MAATLTEEQVEIRLDAQASGSAIARTKRPEIDQDEVLSEIGIWLSGIESFLNSGHHSFADEKSAAASDSSKEFRLVNSGLQRCSMLITRLLMACNGAPVSVQNGREIKMREITELSSALRDLTLLNEGLIHSSQLGTGEWKAWSRMLLARFAGLKGFAKLIELSESMGEKFLPKPLRELAENEGFLSPVNSEIAAVLPRFGRILKWLSVIGRMLETDEPLKPALMIFSRVNEQIFELTTYINSQLERFPDQEAELFASLDAASYTASLELKKVYSQELAGIARMRPSPSIYARMETAHSLLNETFQQILSDFAAMLDPSTSIFELFPNFKRKLNQSVVLKKELASVVETVQSAEKNSEKTEIEKLQKVLRSFMSGSSKFLFYKDTETVERFVEEIFVIKEHKDLVPLLHRFGAFLETLYGQVSLRAVLEKNPHQSKT